MLFTYFVCRNFKGIFYKKMFENCSYRQITLSRKVTWTEMWLRKIWWQCGMWVGQKRNVWCSTRHVISYSCFDYQTYSLPNTTCVPGIVPGPALLILVSIQAGVPHFTLEIWSVEVTCPAQALSLTAWSCSLLALHGTTVRDFKQIIDCNSLDVIYCIWS